MSQLKQFSPQVQPKFSGAGLPVPPVTGARIGDEYRNTSSYELFTCTSLSPETWIGSQGTLSTTITSFSHPDLFAAYTMDNLSGSTLVDEGPNGYNTGTIHNAVQAAGLLNNALSFNGSNAWVDSVASSPPLNFSMSFWFKTTAAATGNLQAFWGQSTGASERAVAINTSGGVFFYSRNVGGGYEGTASLTVTDNQWHHVYIHQDGLELKLRIDDSTEVTHNMASALGGWGTDSNIGRSSTINANAYWNAGLIDQVRFFNRALISSEISTLYNSGAGA